MSCEVFILSIFSCWCANIVHNNRRLLFWNFKIIMTAITILLLIECSSLKLTNRGLWSICFGRTAGAQLTGYGDIYEEVIFEFTFAQAFSQLYELCTHYTHVPGQLPSCTADWIRMSYLSTLTQTVQYIYVCLSCAT